MQRVFLIALVVSALIAGARPAEAQTAPFCSAIESAVGEYFEVRYPGATKTFLNGINERGDIIGGYELGPLDHQRHGFLLRRGVFTPMDVPGADSTVALDINANGSVVGYSLGSAGDRGFLWENGRLVTWQVAGRRTFFAGINASRTIAGSYYDEKLNRWQAFVLRRDRVTLIGPTATDLSALARDITDSGEVLLTVYSNATPSEPATYMVASERGMKPLATCPGAFWTVWKNQHRLAGSISFGDTAPVGAVQSKVGMLTVIEYPGATATSVGGVNNAGWIVGSAQDVPGWAEFVGFVFVPTRGAQVSR
jgi:probable HAF family extracellular repeat protein